METAPTRATAHDRRARRSALWKISAGIAVGALAVGLTACTGSSGGSANSHDKTTIRFLYATGDETWNSTLKAVTDAYNQQSDSTVVKLDALPAGSDYATAMKTMDATGNWAALVDMRETLTYVNAGKLAPIPTEVTSLLDPDVFEPGPDGSVYTVPSTALNGELGINIVYDKDYFKSHNLEVPKTYGEFMDLLKSIKANGDVPLATAAQDIWPSDQLWKQLASPVFAKYSDKGGFWNSVQAKDASLNDLREPLDRLKNITDEYVLPGWQSTADAQTTTLLANHQAIMATSSSGLGRLKDIHNVAPDFNAGIFIIPDDQGTINVLKNSVVGESAPGIAISSQAQKNGAEYTSAVDFLKYYYSVPAANLIEKSGMIAPNIVKSDEVERNTSIPGAEDYFALLKNPQVKWYENSPKVPTFSTFNTFFRQTRIETQDGQTTVDQAIQKAQTEFDKVAAGK